MKKAISITIFIIVIMFLLVVRNSNTNATNERTILFIGNSRTYYNNLPEKVCKLAELDGNSELPDLSYTTIAKGSKTLKWFYDERETYKDKLLSNKWDYIVLQEGMDNALNDDKLDEFKNGAKDIIKFLKQNNCADENTTIIYHATWVKGKKSASSANYSVDKLKTDQKQFNEHYRVVKDYVEQETGIKGKIAYSGNSFIFAIEELHMKVNNLYKDEEGNASIHPTNAGSYLAACTIYETIFRTQVKDFSGEGTANSYDNILDNTYTGAVSSASAGTKTKVENEIREKCQYITRKYVDITQPVISDITVSNEDWTNVPVIIEFKADDNIYKVIINGEEAQNNDGTYYFSATSNGEYNIKVIDLVGNESEVTKNISNIDTTLPAETQPLITCTTSSIKVTNQQEDKESGIDETKTKYRLTDENGSIGEWQTSNVFEELIDNKTYYVQTQVTDKAGNTKDSKITNIDKESIIVTGNPTEWTEEKVILTINAKDVLELAENPYSFDGGETWQAENSKTYEENTRGIIIQVKDISGNIYELEEINITKIRKVQEIIVETTRENPYNPYENIATNELKVYIKYDNGDMEETTDYTVINGESLTCLIEFVEIQYNKNTNINAELLVDVLHDIQEATCMQNGKCKIQGCTYIEEATGHTEVVDAKVEPNCIETGLTEGKHCSVCDEILVAQEEIPAKGHNYENGECTRCGEKEQEEEIEITSEKYIIKNEVISNIQPGTTIQELKQNLETNATEVNIYNNQNEKLNNSDIIGTQMKLELKNGDKVSLYTIVVNGDTNGDGKSNINDIFNINSHRLGIRLLTEARLQAADVNGDGVADVRDIFRINNYRLRGGQI